MDSWDIVINEDVDIVKDILLEEFQSKPFYFLLDHSKSEFTVFEKLIYDIAYFHLKRLNIENINEYYIECWTHNRFCTEYILHLDIDEIQYKTGEISFPLLTTLTYFNDIEIPTMITNITKDDMVVNLNDNNIDEFYLSFPKMLKNISFEGFKYYHGAINVLGKQNIRQERFILGMNLWQKRINDIEYYNFNLYKTNTRSRTFLTVDKSYPLFNIQQSLVDTVKISVNEIITYFITNEEERKSFVKNIFLDELKVVNICKQFKNKLNLKIYNNFHILVIKQ